MPSHARQPSLWWMLGGVLRPVAAACITIAILLWWISHTGRGFLESLHRVIWLELTPAGDRTWEVRQIAAGPMDTPDPPHLPDAGDLRIAVQENSMGRTHMGLFGSWRASYWTCVSLVDHSGHTDSLLVPDAVITDSVRNACGMYLEQVVIPVSPPAAMWKSPPLVAERDGRLSWSAYQRRTHWFAIIGTVGTATAIGIGVARLCFAKTLRTKA